MTRAKWEWWSARCVTGWALAMATLLLSGCGGRSALWDLVEARKDSAALRVAFLEETGASTRAVLADHEEAMRAAQEARDASARVTATAGTLRARLAALGYAAETKMLAGFDAQYGEYVQLEQEVLGLVAENTNSRAQRLASGDGQRAADAFFEALSRVAGLGSGAPDVRASLLEIQLLEMRHILEADDAPMMAMERRMDALAARARAPLAARSGDAAAAEALRALEAFLAVHADVVALSRRNTDVKGLALTLGRKRLIAAACETSLAELDRLLAGHGSEATR